MNGNHTPKWHVGLLRMFIGLVLLFVFNNAQTLDKLEINQAKVASQIDYSITKSKQHTNGDIKQWHGKKAAVVLTYDDALDVHLDNVVPALDLLGLKATFYLTIDASGSKGRMQDWRNAALNGHELGNHTWFHPCDGSKPGRSWVSASNDLSQYSTDQIVKEIEMTNVFLEALDGKRERTFAYTCGDMETSQGSFVEAVKGKFISMRGVHGRVNKLETLDLTNIDCFVVDENNADQLIHWAEKAKEENGLLVILFHGVGGGHSINVDLKKHHDFLDYLKKHQDDYWVTTLLEASKHSLQQLKKEN